MVSRLPEFPFSPYVLARSIQLLLSVMIAALIYWPNQHWALALLGMFALLVSLATTPRLRPSLVRSAMHLGLPVPAASRRTQS